MSSFMMKSDLKKVINHLNLNKIFYDILVLFKCYLHLKYHRGSCCFKRTFILHFVKIAFSTFINTLLIIKYRIRDFLIDLVFLYKGKSSDSF
jgi:hypothetical protein